MIFLRRSTRYPLTYSYISSLRKHLQNLGACIHQDHFRLTGASLPHLSGEEATIQPKHIPVMTNEVLEILKPEKGKIILDMTFGAGGHTKHLLQTERNITIFCLDRDPVAYNCAMELSKDQKQVIPLLGKFSQIHELLRCHGLGESSLDGALFDVGASSMQFDDKSSGFSLSQDSPLDMRMDRGSSNGITAEDVVNNLEEDGLYKILKQYGEEKRARRIARTIVDSRYAFGRIKTTKQLANVVASVFEGGFEQRDKLYRQAHVATRTFQALRIFVNNELNELYNGLNIIHKLLKPGAPCAVISFHSLEDRIVKRCFHGIDMDAKLNQSVVAQHRAISRGFGADEMEEILHKDWQPIVKGAMLPTDHEVANNPRSRSAKLRAATKL